MESNRKKIALIVGAGAVENSWLPIIEVLKQDYNFDFDADSANCFLARCIYILRHHATNDDPIFKANLQHVLNDFSLIKLQISKALYTYELKKKIYPRKEFYLILDKFIFQNSVEYAVISTNWDTVIDKAINNRHDDRCETFHLHGSINDHKTLYLPSEVAMEPYRSEQSQQNILGNHATMMHAIDKSNCVILYGLSLDPLDAELSQILALGFGSSNIKEIIIINPDHERIAKRVKLLLPIENEKIDVFAYLPNDLSKKIQY